MNILLVEDKDSLRKMLKTALTGAGYSVETASRGDNAIELIKSRQYHLILSDLKLPGADGLEILKASMELHPSPSVIILTAFGTIEQAVEAIKRGASDFLAKPVDLDHLFVVVERALKRQQLMMENILLKEEYESKFGFPVIVGESDAIKETVETVKKAARTGATVLLEGESGTGKELFARAVHCLSDRVDQPFVAINCAAIPENLLENELFGHEKGAYTGAVDRKIGKFELAGKGTLFFDEISELNLSIQSKVLRLIQEKNFERIGGLVTITSDVRLVAATNKNLEQETAEGRFREDLFYRLNVFPVYIPPLRERKGDIVLLAEHFLEKFKKEMKKQELSFSEEAVSAINNYSWPGNVRELENAVERAVILCDSDKIEIDHLVFNRQMGKNRIPFVNNLDGSLKEVCERAKKVAEKRKIEAVLEKTDGNLGKAATLLEINIRSLKMKIKEHDIG